MPHPRRPQDLPAALTQFGWRYHHLGIPYSDPHPEETHLPHLGIHVHGYETSPYGIEWIRFDPTALSPHRPPAPSQWMARSGRSRVLVAVEHPNGCGEHGRHRGMGLVPPQ